MKTYLYWSEKLEINKLQNGMKILVKRKDFDGELPTKEDIQTIRLNETAAEIIQLIDGTKSYNDIVSFLSNKYNENFQIIDEKVRTFLRNIDSAYGLKINSQENLIKIPVYFLDESHIYPSVASIELTNKCNVRCLHCYGDFGNLNQRILDLEQAKTLLNDLKKVGVKILELTGGEMTVHPNIREIILHAIDLQFEQINLLSNGIALNRKLKNIIIENKSRIFMQIDVHSLKEDYLTWFFQVPNTLKLIKKNIKELAENGVRMRTATIITRKNLHELETIADWVHSLGIGHFGVSPVVELGRAADPDLFLTYDELTTADEALRRITNKYPNFVALIEGDRMQKENCGAIASHCVIAPNGNLKICTMDNMDFNSSIGNVFEKNIKEIYMDNSDFITSFYSMKSPQMNSSECSNCENKLFCSACIIRGLIKAKEMGNKCLWYSNTVPNLVKEKFKLEKSASFLT